MVLRVDIVMRSDYLQTHGGDVVQVQQYLDRLPADIDVILHPVGPRIPVREHAVVHIVNMDREWDFLEAVRQATPRPLVVTPIHHKRSAVARISTGNGWSARLGSESGQRGRPKCRLARTHQAYRPRAVDGGPR